MKMHFCYEIPNEEDASDDIVLVLEYGKCSLHDLLNLNRF